jgi:hypothetical protein
MHVSDLHSGDQVRWSSDDPIVTVLKVKRDQMGYDVLYQHGGSAPRWRGFDDGDRVLLVQRAVQS